MKFTPKREIDKGFIINWIADRVNSFGCWLVEVSNRYAMYYTAEFDEEEQDSQLSEFEQIGERLRDRAAYTQGVKDTEERFIKLLEAIVTDWRKCDLHNQADTFDYAIALIKGENK